MAHFNMESYRGFFVNKFNPSDEIKNQLKLFGFEEKETRRRGIFFGKLVGSNDFDDETYIHNQELDFIRDFSDEEKEYIYNNLPKDIIIILNFIST